MIGCNFAEKGDMDISQRENYIGKFGDSRLDRRAMQLSSLLYFGQSGSIHGVTSTEAEQKGAYRFLANEKAEEKILIETVKERSGYLCSGRDVLVIQDTTEINLDNHRNRLKRGTGIGLTGNNKALGFFMHGSIVLDAADETMLGFSDVQLWHRDEQKQTKEERRYKSQPIEEKESYKWIQACIDSKEQLKEARSVTFIEDREGDIYEQFAMIPDGRTHLVIRCCRDRNLGGGGKLYERLAAQPPCGEYGVKLVKDIRKGIESRIATVEVRYCRVSIAKPKRTKGAKLPKTIEVYAVEVREKDVPDGCAPVLWRILTTHVVTSYEEAVGIIKKYKLRWYIEQLFRLLKEKGFRIESSELETGWAIRKLTVMALNAALRVMQLLLARGNDGSQPVGEVFSQGEVECLRALNQSLEGDTEKSRNKNNPAKLSWAAWVIARLGGWKNYNSKRPPGPILLKKGLDKFNSIYQGWSMARAS
jgi:hypothetical protein